MKTIKIILCTLLISINITVYSQVAINSDGSAADVSAILEVKSSNGGILFPRMTEAQRNAIASPATTLIIYNTDTQTLEYFDGTNWKGIIVEDCYVPDQPGDITGITNPACVQTGLSYSITAVPFAASYTWTVPGDATLVSGQGTTGITVDMGIQTGNVSVRAETGCGNSSYKDLAITSDNFIPVQPGDITGNQLVDDYTSGETYSITAVSGATSYTWTVPTGSSITSGQGTTSIIVNFVTESGNLSVYASNACGNSGATNLFVNVFACGDEFTDENDTYNKSYSTVQINTQCWMSENLAATNYNDGSFIPLASDTWHWITLTTPAYCWYNNNQSSYGETYGVLYNWYTVNTGMLCPSGWHVPTDAEWCTLENEVDAGTISCSDMGWRGTDAGGKMKETGTTHWNSPNTGATNESGFTALPGGNRHPGGDFQEMGNSGYWWSATQWGNSDAWYRAMSYNLNKVNRYGNTKKYGFSVRCLRD